MYLLNNFKRGKDLKKRKARNNLISKTTLGATGGSLLGAGISKLANKNSKIGIASGLLLGAGIGNIYARESNKYNQSPLLYKSKVHIKENYEKIRNKANKAIKKVNNLTDKIENYNNTNLNNFKIFQVKESRRTGKKGTYLVKAHSRQRKDKQPIIENAAKSVAAVVGLSALGYLALKGRYRANMQKTLANAVKKADTMDISKFKINPKSESLIFTVAGTGGIKNAQMQGAGLAAAVKGITRNRNTFDITNKKFNLKSKFNYKALTEEVNTNLNKWKELNPSATAEQIAEQAFKLRDIAHKKHMGVDHPIGIAKQLFKTYVKRGRNTQVEDTLATVIALHKKTGKPVNLVGVSGGGIVMDEVSEHLTNLKIPHKGVNLGSPNFGFTKPNKSVIGVAGKNDPLVNILPTHNRKTVNGGRNHDITDYLTDKEVQKLFKEHLY